MGFRVYFFCGKLVEIKKAAPGRFFYLD